MNIGTLGSCIKDFNDLRIVKEKVRPHETLALFYRMIVDVRASVSSYAESMRLQAQLRSGDA